MALNDNQTNICIPGQILGYFCILVGKIGQRNDYCIHIVLAKLLLYSRMFKFLGSQLDFMDESEGKECNR